LTKDMESSGTGSISSSAFNASMTRVPVSTCPILVLRMCFCFDM
jgi:hypothetical protein